MANWRAASTAPRHGSEFIAWDPNCGLLFSMHWDDEDKRFMTRDERWSGHFTHWQPLPKEPK